MRGERPALARLAAPLTAALHPHCALLQAVPGGAGSALEGEKDKDLASEGEPPSPAKSEGTEGDVECGICLDHKVGGGAGAGLVRSRVLGGRHVFFCFPFLGLAHRACAAERSAAQPAPHCEPHCLQPPSLARPGSAA